MDSTHINFNYLKEISNGNVEFEKMMINLYLSKTYTELLNLENAVDSKNLEMTQHLAHKLVSTAAIIGAKELKNNLLKIESLASEVKNIGEIKNLLFGIIKCHNQIKLELNQALLQY